MTGSIGHDVPALLLHHDCPRTAAHCGRVAAESLRIAVQASVDPDAAEIAGWLHDVSAVIPIQQRVVVAKEWDVEILPEEERFPMIIHQKLSRVLARDVFGIEDDAVLEAVQCHTTLRAGARALDKTLFVADKVAWDQPGDPPYRDGLLQALDESLDAAVAHHLQYLWNRRRSLAVIHPWLKDAWRDIGIVTDKDDSDAGE